VKGIARGANQRQSQIVGLDAGTFGLGDDSRAVFERELPGSPFVGLDDGAAQQIGGPRERLARFAGLFEKTHDCRAFPAKIRCVCNKYEMSISSKHLAIARARRDP
jgi:hypothetical protein